MSDQHSKNKSQGEQRVLTMGEPGPANKELCHDEPSPDGNTSIEGCKHSSDTQGPNAEQKTSSDVDPAEISARPDGSPASTGTKRPASSQSSAPGQEKRKRFRNGLPKTVKDLKLLAEAGDQEAEAKLAATRDRHRQSDATYKSKEEPQGSAYTLGPLPVQKKPKLSPLDHTVRAAAGDKSSKEVLKKKRMIELRKSLNVRGGSANLRKLAESRDQEAVEVLAEYEERLRRVREREAEKSKAKAAKIVGDRFGEPEDPKEEISERAEESTEVLEDFA